MGWLMNIPPSASVSRDAKREPEPQRFYVGLDLGQATDYTAIAVVECVGPEDGDAEYHVRHLERVKLRTPYTEIVRRVKEIKQSIELQHEVWLVVDATGVGAPVVDLLSDLYPVAIKITGGDKVHFEGGDYTVPKRDLIGTLTVLLQTRRLKLADGLEFGQVFINELLNYRVTISDAGHESYNAREGAHDDLILAVALACWYGEYRRKYRPRITTL